MIPKALSGSIPSQRMQYDLSTEDVGATSLPEFYGSLRVRPGSG